MTSIDFSGGFVIVSNLMKYFWFLQLFVLITTRCAYSAENISEAKLNQFAQSAKWLSLLHDKNFYADNVLPHQYTSEIAGGDFFLSEQGKTNSLAELKATIESINSEKRIGLGQQRPFCAFRARYHLLQQELGLEMPAIKCEKWDLFIKGFNDPQKLSLIFSSAYPNSPASMFGHLFLKVSSKLNTDLLDTGINYAAQVPQDENGLAFLVFGIFGGYEGHWSVQPYYEKLNEYVKSESRDLWEYELKLTKEEVYFFIEHLWELETTGVNYYYFFDDNCAYRIARIIEVIKPEWRTQSKSLARYTINAIPGEIVKNFEIGTQVNRVSHKQALRKKLNLRLQMLTLDEKNIFNDYNKQENSDLLLIKSIKVKDRQIHVLNALNVYIDYIRQKRKGKLTDLDRAKWTEVQSYRAELGVGPRVELNQDFITNQPDRGHDSYGFGFQVGQIFLFNTQQQLSHTESGAFLDYTLRSPYHDLKNIDQGFDEFSQILFPAIDGRYLFEKKKHQLTRLNAVDIKSLVPYTNFDPQISWMLNAKYEQSLLNDVHNDYAISSDLAAGLSSNVNSEHNILYGFLGLRNEFLNARLNDQKIFLFSSVGYIQNINELMKISFNFKYLKSLNDTNSLFLESFNQFEQDLTYSIHRNFEWRESFKIDQKKIKYHDQTFVLLDNYVISTGPVFYFR